MTLSAWQATVQDANGNIVPNAEVTVLVESTGLPATIYSTRGGAALSNPFTADINGFAQFYANKGEYRITAVSGVFSNIFRYVRIGDAGGYDVQSSPSDATAGRLLTNETTSIGGFVNYTGANLNPNVFGGGTVGVVADGYANSSSIAVFTANIISNTAPVSISVVGSFSVYTATDALIAAGVVPVLGSIKSNRVAPFVVTGLTGLTAKENLTLRPDTTSSKITVNF